VNIEAIDLDFTNAIEAFPELAFFPDIVHQSMMRMICYMMDNGARPEKLQTMIDTDMFIITLAGSVYSQLQNNPFYGCDARDYDP